MVDVSSRAYQNIDIRIPEVRRALNYVRTAYEVGDKPPHVQFISQGTDADILNYAGYYSLDDRTGQPRQLFSYADQVSWSPTEPMNMWQRKIGEDALRQMFVEADLIWPIITDPWVSGILRSLVPAGTCFDRPEDSLLVKGADGTFSCRAKPTRERLQ